MLDTIGLSLRVGVSLIILVLGIYLIIKNIDWYRSLDKPIWAPDAYFIVIIWSFLYCLTIYVWISCLNIENKILTDIIFQGMLCSQILWVIFFFGNHALSLSSLFNVLLVFLSIQQILRCYFINYIDGAVFSVLVLVWLIIMSFVNFNLIEAPLSPIKVSTTSISTIAPEEQE